MNAILYALNQAIAISIPSEVLDRAFYDINEHNNLSTQNLICHLQDEVIYKFLLPAMNTVGGRRMIIPLNSVEPTVRGVGSATDRFTRIYRVPKSLTQGRSIISALSISYGAYMNVGTVANTAGSSQLLGAADQLVNSVNGPQVNSTSNVSLIGDNVIMIRDAIQMYGGVNLECYLEHDPTLADIQPRLYQSFTEIVVLAIKAYIYNKLIIKLDMGFIHAGRELGIIGEIIKGYADAEQMFMEKIRTDWPRISRQGDFETESRFIAMQLGFGK